MAPKPWAPTPMTAGTPPGLSKVPGNVLPLSMVGSFSCQ